MDHRRDYPQVNAFVPHALAFAADDSPFTVQQAEMSFSAFFSPHLGHATFSSLSRSPLNVSKVSPHAWHRYSYRGISLLLCFLIRASIAFSHQKVDSASIPKFAIVIRPRTYRILFFHPSVKLATVKPRSARQCGRFRHDLQSTFCFQFR
jgi:hypothetical protein